jgi:hypothetical protein
MFPDAEDLVGSGSGVAKVETMKKLEGVEAFKVLYERVRIAHPTLVSKVVAHLNCILG